MAEAQTIAPAADTPSQAVGISIKHLYKVFGPSP